MFVLSLLSYKLRTKTAKTSFICYKQAVYTVYTVEFIHNSDFWATKVEKSA